MTRSRTVLTGACLAAIVGMTACGAPAAPAPAAPPAPAPSTDAAADEAAFCEAVVDVDAATAGPPPVDFETATPEEIEAALTEYGAMLEPLLVAVEDATPAEVGADVATLTGAVRATAAGDPGAAESPEVAMANAGLDGWMLANCGYDELAITATDHEYEGVPDTLPAGVTALTMSNEGEEVHVAGVLRINEGVTQSFEEILMLPEEEALQMVTPVGGVFAPPGAADTGFVRLEPGSYAVFCPLPEGSIPPAEGTGPPHFVLGMIAELTVE